MTTPELQTDVQQALPHAFSAPSLRGVLRQQPADFFVREELSFQPGDGGEHLWLFVRKTGWNTTDLALWLARAAKLPLRAVGYSGLKDRNEVTIDTGRGKRSFTVTGGNLHVFYID